MLHIYMLSLSLSLYIYIYIAKLHVYAINCCTKKWFESIMFSIVQFKISDQLRL